MLHQQPEFMRAELNCRNKQILEVTLHSQMRISLCGRCRVLRRCLRILQLFGETWSV